MKFSGFDESWKRSFLQLLRSDFAFREELRSIMVGNDSGDITTRQILAELRQLRQDLNLEVTSFLCHAKRASYLVDRSGHGSDLPLYRPAHLTQWTRQKRTARGRHRLISQHMDLQRRLQQQWQQQQQLEQEQQQQQQQQQPDYAAAVEVDGRDPITESMARMFLADSEYQLPHSSSNSSSQQPRAYRQQQQWEHEQALESDLLQRQREVEQQQYLEAERFLQQQQQYSHDLQTQQHQQRPLQQQQQQQQQSVRSRVRSYRGAPTATSAAV